jgi:2-keto-4-pentenoate hydratase
MIAKLRSIGEKTGTMEDIRKVAMDDIRKLVRETVDEYAEPIFEHLVRGERVVISLRRVSKAVIESEVVFVTAADKPTSTPGTLS